MGKLMGVEQLFEGRHFDREVIILCVRWYLRFKLSLRDLRVEMMAERGLSLAHTTIMRWVRRYAPEFEKRCPGGRPVMEGGRDIRQNSRRMALSLSCRGSGGGGRLTSRLSVKRDVAAAKAFFGRRSKASTMLPGRSPWTAMPRLTARCVS